MMNNNRFWGNATIIFVVVFMVAIVGCAVGRRGQKTLGEQMFEKGKQAQELGKKWNKANEIVVGGEKLIDPGEKQVHREWNG